MKFLGLSLAGVVSFSLAVGFHRWTSEGTEVSDAVVMPVERVRRPAGQGANVQANPAALNQLGAAQDRPLQGPTGLPRMDHRVTANPFAALTLGAKDIPVPARIPPTANPTPPATPVVQLASPLPVVTAPVSSPALQPGMPPTLPFVAIGGIQGTRIAEGRPVVFLRQRDEVMAVRTGDSINEVYQVEAITPERIDFIYLPLKLRQSLSLAP